MGNVLTTKRESPFRVAMKRNHSKTTLCKPTWINWSILYCNNVTLDLNLTSFHFSLFFLTEWPLNPYVYLIKIMLVKFKRDFIGNLFALDSQRSIAWKCHNPLFGELTMYVLRNGVCASKALETWVTRQTYLLGSSININKNMRLAF